VKGIEVDLYTVDQETLLGASCGKSRKFYQMVLYNREVILKRGGGGSEAFGEGGKHRCLNK
jgi:hypothetical protein